MMHEDTADVAHTHCAEDPGIYIYWIVIAVHFWSCIMKQTARLRLFSAN